MPTKIDKSERKKLKISWVGEPQQLPNSQVRVLRFNAEDGLQYETYKQSLFPYIAVDAELDADCELRITKGSRGQPYPHWRIVQLYDKGGKPLASTKPERQFGRDQDRTDFRTAILETGENYRAGLWKDKDPEVIAYRLWIYTVGFGFILNLAVRPNKVEPPEQPVKNAKELMAWALKHGKEYTPSWLRKELNLGNQLITDEHAIKYYEILKQKKGWED